MENNHSFPTSPVILDRSILATLLSSKQEEGHRKEPDIVNRLGEVRRSNRERSIRFLDNVIDASRYPLKETEKITKGNRKIGLGVMGFADMLIRLGIPYGSEASFRLAEKVMSFINNKAWERVRRDWHMREGPFPNFKGSIFDKEGEKPVRNATTTTIAPTGTLSIIANCSSGIEPLFSISYTRNVLNGTELKEVTPLLEEIAREEGFYDDGLMRKVLSGKSLNKFRRDTGRVQKDICDRLRYPSRLPYKDAGCLPEIHGQCRIQDHQLSGKCNQRRCRGSFPYGL